MRSLVNKKWILLTVFVLICILAALMVATTVSANSVAFASYDGVQGVNADISDPPPCG